MAAGFGASASTGAAKALAATAAANTRGSREIMKSGPLGKGRKRRLPGQGWGAGDKDTKAQT
jgi:hypothetical protein